MGVTFIMERRPIQVLDPHCRFTDIGTAAGAPPVGAVDRAASTQEGGLFRYPFQRLQGDLLLGQAGNGSTAEACYQRALRVAGAADALARIARRDQPRPVVGQPGRGAEARELLAPIYG